MDTTHQLDFIAMIDGVCHIFDMYSGAVLMMRVLFAYTQLGKKHLVKEPVMSPSTGQSYGDLA